MSSAPQPYERVTSFYSFEATYPTQPKSGASLDAEFNAVRSSLNATQARLAEIQRDDGSLANASVHPQSITSETYVLLGSDYIPKGSWLTATLYDAADLVEHNGLNYLAIVDHTSDDFDVDLASGKWQAFGGYPTAAQVVFAPGGTVGALSVQDAILEIDNDVQNKQPLSSLLSAIAALEPPGDSLIYFLDAGPALATLTSAARTFIAAIDAAAQRTAIGIVPGASAGNYVVLDGSAKLPGVDGSQLTNVVVPDASITAAKLATTLDLSGKTVTLPTANTPVFTKSFESTQQTITAAGALTIAHGLGVKPKLIQAVLVCLVADGNYAINDEVIVNTNAQTFSTTDRGISVVPDATNLNVRYAANANTFMLLNKTTGVSFAATNSSWRLVLRAYA